MEVYALTFLRSSGALPLQFLRYYFSVIITFSLYELSWLFALAVLKVTSNIYKHMLMPNSRDENLFD